MSTPWLTAKELAGLPGMLSSERRTRDKLLQLSVPSRPREGRGGGREFDCSALPTETQKALMLDSVATASHQIAALVDAPAVVAPPPPALLAVESGRPPPSQSDKAVADARVILVNQVLQMAETGGVRQATLVMAQQLSAGECSQELIVAARTANLRARSAAVSDRSLFRWLATFQKLGWWGLLPTPTNPAVATANADDVAAVLGKYLTRDPAFRNLSNAAQEVTKALGRELDTWRNLYDRARRALAKVDRTAVIKARHSGAERAAMLPFKRRDTSVLRPLDVWLIDGHTFKAKVRHPDHGAPFAPEVTIVIDASTRRVCGWSVALSENVIAVGDALRHAVTQVGVPAIIYSDNGAGETAKQMDCPVTGIVARLGAEHRTGIPGHPQGHGLIERSWRTHMIKCARQFGSYQGKDVDSRTLRNVSRELASEQRAVKRAEGTGEVIQLSNKAPSWQQFVDAVDAQVNEYNATHRHRSLPKNAQGKHMTPDEAWAAWINPQDQHIPGTLEARMLFMPALLRTAKRGEVTFLNQVYFSGDLMQVDGQQVRVHYDIHDPSFVLVFDLDGGYICEAKWNANRIDYYPKPVIEMAREKRVRGIVRRKQDQIDTALRELSGTTTVSLPEPTAPVVIGLINPADSLSQPSYVPVLEPAVRTAAGRPFFDAPSDRYEWLMTHRNDWTADDSAWTANYVRGEDYAELRDYYASRALDWKDGEAGLESAR